MEPLTSSQGSTYLTGPVTEQVAPYKSVGLDSSDFESAEELMLSNVGRSPGHQIREKSIEDLRRLPSQSLHSFEEAKDNMVGIYHDTLLGVNTVVQQRGLAASGEVERKIDQRPADNGNYDEIIFKDEEKTTGHEIKRSRFSEKKKSIRGRLTPRSDNESEGEKVKVRHRKDLGQGGFGLVWLGKLQKSEDTMTEYVSGRKSRKKVAVKEFKNVEDRELAVVKTLIDEKPDQVPRLYGVLNYKGKDHLVMKYCNRGTLSNYLGNHIDDKRKCYKKLISMMTTLRNFHKAGFCHRDIHEGNVLIHKKKDGRYELYLTDFGHAIKVDAPEGTMPPVGKMGVFFWNSPLELSRLHNRGKTASEKHQGKKDERDFRAYNKWLDANPQKIDIYQAGMLIFRVATAEGGEMKVPQQNLKQQALVLHIKSLEETEGLSDKEIRSQVRKYLRTHHEELDSSLIKLLADMFSPTKKVSLKRVCHVLEEISGE